MRVFQCGGNALHVADSDDLIKAVEAAQSPKSFLEHIANEFLNFYHDPDLRVKIWKFLKLYSKWTGLRNHAMLNAHGKPTNFWFKKDFWYYQDGVFRVPVQKWIDASDGKYLCLFLFCCNRGNFRPRTKHSLLVLADNVLDFDLRYLERKKAKTVFFAPRFGEEITSNNIGAYIKILKVLNGIEKRKNLQDFYGSGSPTASVCHQARTSYIRNRVLRFAVQGSGNLGIGAGRYLRFSNGALMVPQRQRRSGIRF